MFFMRGYLGSCAFFIFCGVMEKKSTAVFIGHSDCYGVTVDAVTPVIEEAIKSGIDTFLNGGQGGFDRLCARAVFNLKQKYPQIKNYLVIPYQRFRIFDKELFDEIIYPFEEERESYYSYKSAIPKRNKWMIEHSSTAICYVTHPSSGAYKTFDLAIKSGLKISPVV